MFNNRLAKFLKTEHSALPTRCEPAPAHHWYSTHPPISVLICGTLCTHSCLVTRMCDNHNIKRANKCFHNVANFKYLETTETN
jgi:hypothetical protein